MVLGILCEIQRVYPPTELVDPAYTIVYTHYTKDTKCSEYKV